MLTWSEVQYWCDTHQLDSETAHATHRYTLELDNVWVSLHPKPKDT